MGRLSCALPTSLAVLGLQRSDKVKSHETGHLSGVAGGVCDSQRELGSDRQRGSVLWKELVALEIWGAEQAAQKLQFLPGDEDICPHWGTPVGGQVGVIL